MRPDAAGRSRSTSSQRSRPGDMNRVSPVRIVDLTADRSDWIEQAAALLQHTFAHRTDDWKDLPSARATVAASLDEGHVSLVALNEGDRVIGWVGGLPTY